MKIEESLNMTFDETPPPSKTSPLVDDDLDEKEAIKVSEKKNLENDNEDENLEVDEIINIKESKNHPLGNIIGNLNQRTLRRQQGRTVRDTLRPECQSPVCWTKVGVVESLAPTLNRETTKKIIRIRNKIQEALNHRHSYADVRIRFGKWGKPNPRHIGPFKIIDKKCLPDETLGIPLDEIQIDDKLYFVEEPVGIMDREVNHLKQSRIHYVKAPFGGVTGTKWVYRNKLDEKGIVSRNKARYEAHKRRIIVCLFARFQEDPKTSHLEAVKLIFRYIKGNTHLGLWYPKGTGIDPVVYADSDHAGDYVDRKSTSGVPIKGHCSFSDKWSLDYLETSVPTNGSYQTTPPYPDDIKALIQFDREGPLTWKDTSRSWHERCHHSSSTSSSSGINHPSASHHIDDDNDVNDEGTSRTSVSSSIRVVNSLFTNPPHDNQNLQTLHTRQTEILNLQVQLRDEHRNGLRLIEKELKNLLKGRRK
ncbi:hypothetical protein Tco_0052630 [Tanacetum coccineum]